jgi:hypothetical protein
VESVAGLVSGGRILHSVDEDVAIVDQLGARRGDSHESVAGFLRMRGSC